ncbi:NAD(P)/FAD-dependent oxidoreductase [Alicyclobacillus herbarius]|uniref:NAD(P)/FAD-dependent oxidoreductase n=1 Tax=Alicyclobacillus herbarius TaxID=122960 RepID=UPI0004188A53|nr:NAD(P)/FAD-dependent oxidoreductase [Alicyclobacillus herbarius]
MAKTFVLGAGYAGAMTAVQLDKIAEPFTLINKTPYHTLVTLLHEAAGGRGTPTNYAVNLTDLIHRETSNIVVDEVTAIDREKKVLKTRSGQEHEYEWLVIALGWVSEYFGIPGLKEHSLVLNDLDTAIQIRQHIEDQFAAYKDDPNPERLRIVVGGAGLTGVELAGELLDWLPSLCTKYGIDRNLVELQNIEAMSTILPMISESLRNEAARMLTEKGAILRTNTKIVKVTENEVHLEGGESVKARTIIWTGGVRANPLLTEAGFTVDRRGRAKVNEFLQSVDDSHIFIGGDSAWVEDENGRPLPPTAQYATQMGYVLAANVSSAIHRQPLRPFHPHNMGTLASVGPEVGVGNMFGIPVKGLAAGLAKEASKLKYLYQIGGLRLTAEKTPEIAHF